MGRPPKSDWKKGAAEARKKLQSAKHGKRDSTLWGAVADDQNANTLRRQIYALNFLDEIKKSNPSLFKIVSDLSFSFVEQLARWHSFDTKATAEAAEKVLNGKYTVQGLADDVIAARAKAPKSGSPAAYQARLNEIALRLVRLQFSEAWDQETDPSSYPMDSVLDFHFRFQPDRQWGGPAQEIAVVIVGPYQDERVYSKRRRDWVLRAFGLSLVYDHVVLLMTTHAPLQSYQDAVAEAEKQRQKPDVPPPAPRSIKILYAPISEPSSPKDGPQSEGNATAGYADPVQGRRTRRPR